MKKLTITLIVSEDTAIQVLVQKLANIIPDLNKIGDISDISLYTEGRYLVSFSTPPSTTPITMGS